MARPKKPKRLTKMDWKEVIKLFLETAVKFVPFPFNLFLPILLDFLLPLLDKKTVAAAPVFAAPDELREWLLQFLTDAVNKIQRPLIRRVLLVLIDNMGGGLIDALWDALLGKGVITGPAASTFPPTMVMRAAGPPPTEAELMADVEAEFAAC